MNQEDWDYPVLEATLGILNKVCICNAIDFHSTSKHIILFLCKITISDAYKAGDEVWTRSSIK